jgi:hypothetical protein
MDSRRNGRDWPDVVRRDNVQLGPDSRLGRFARLSVAVEHLGRVKLRAPSRGHLGIRDHQSTPGCVLHDYAGTVRLLSPTSPTFLCTCVITYIVSRP